MSDLRVGRVVIPAGDLTWRAVRSSGPGGQNVNKVASKVELRFDLDGTRALDDESKTRLRALAGTRSGEVIVTSQATRDQKVNLDDARAKLAALIARALHRPRKRRPTKPTRSSVERRLSEKQRHSKQKAERSRPH